MKKEKPPVTYDTRYRYQLDMLEPGTIMLKWVGIFLLIGLALELPMEELRELLGKAGYSLTHASEFDIIVEYFVTQGIYNVFTINEALFAFDQNLIGV